MMMGIEDDDSTQLEAIKSKNSRSKKTLKSVLSGSKFNKNDLDEFFCEY